MDTKSFFLLYTLVCVCVCVESKTESVLCEVPCPTASGVGASDYAAGSRWNPQPLLCCCRRHGACVCVGYIRRSLAALRRSPVFSAEQSATLCAG